MTEELIIHTIIYLMFIFTLYFGVRTLININKIHKLQEYTSELQARINEAQRRTNGRQSKLKVDQ